MGTHIQFTESHNDPEVQGTSGGEHLHKQTHYKHKQTLMHQGWSSHTSVTHSRLVAARLMMEWSGRLDIHSQEVWLTKVTMTTVRSILGGDSSIS